MGGAHKKAEKPFETKPALEGAQVLPEDISLMIEGFDVHFKNGAVEAKRSYRNVGVIVTSEKGGKVSETETIFKRVDITAAFKIKPLFSNDVFEERGIRAAFKPSGDEYRFDGSVIREWSKDKKEAACFTKSFTDKFYKDFWAFHSH